MKGYVTAIILAGGSGSRMSSEITKQRMNICGKSVLWHSVKAFETCEKIDSIVVVCRADEIDWAKDQLVGFDKIHNIVVGGKTRAESARLGFLAIPAQSDFVAIHDGARCLVTPADIDTVVEFAFENGAATAVAKISDTVKLCEDGFINKTLPREQMYSAQTPQIFSTDIYSRALSVASPDDMVITDDNMLAELLGEKIAIVDIGRENIKITTPADLDFAEFVLRRRSDMDEIRIGHGYDVHRFAEGRRLILGGIEIPSEKGLLGHSDADVLTHAVMDALLGAAGLGDIGKHFPDTSDEFKDISSLILLRRVGDALESEGYKIGNVDVTLILQKPKISPYVDSMRAKIADVLGIELSRINIKATTEERLGFTGREEGAACHAVALLKK